jgi:hypothetical protein
MYCHVIRGGYSSSIALHLLFAKCYITVATNSSNTSLAGQLGRMRAVGNAALVYRQRRFVSSCRCGQSRSAHVQLVLIAVQSVLCRRLDLLHLMRETSVTTCTKVTFTVAVYALSHT